VATIGNSRGLGHVDGLLASTVAAVVFGWTAHILGRTRIYGYEVLVLAFGRYCVLSPWTA
jgi:hypothetical protein